MSRKQPPDSKPGRLRWRQAGDRDLLTDAQPVALSTCCLSFDRTFTSRTTGGSAQKFCLHGSQGEIWDRPGLDRRQRALVAVAAFTALRLDAQAAKFARSALNVGLSSTEIIETVIQTGPYSGLAPALNALAALSQAMR